MKRLVILLAVTAALAQSPNTASLIVLVQDPAGQLVRDAQITIANSATGAARTALTAADGAVTLPALPLYPLRFQVRLRHRRTPQYLPPSRRNRHSPR